MKPAVTVTLCAYNHAGFVGLTLDRLSQQTFQNFKIVACDDGSTDGTYEILKEYEEGSLHGKLRVLTHSNHANEGIQATKAKCMEHVDTEYFMGTASDDFWELDTLEYLVGLMTKNPEFDFLYGQVNAVNAQGSSLYRFEGVRNIGAGLAAAEKLVFGNSVLAPSMMYRNSCKSLISGVPKNLVFHDWYQNVLLFLSKNPCSYDKPVVNYRLHETNVSLGRSSDFLLARHAEVAGALLENPLVANYPTLKLGLLSILHSSECSTASSDCLRTKMKAVLEDPSVKARKKELLKRTWNACDLKTDSGGCKFMEILPYLEGVRVLTRLGFAAASCRVRHYIENTCLKKKIRAVSQLGVSLVVCNLLAVRDLCKTCFCCLRPGRQIPAAGGEAGPRA